MPERRRGPTAQREDRRFNSRPDVQELARLRREVGLSQQDLGDLAGVRQASVSRAEGGRSSEVLIRKLVDILRNLSKPPGEDPANPTDTIDWLNNL